MTRKPSVLSPSSLHSTAMATYLGQMSEALVRARAERDIRTARAAAEAAIRVRSTFLENMNHELRTPLNAIIGFAEMLKQTEDLDLSGEQIANYLDYILQSADLLLAHINTILEVAAVDNGTVTPQQEAVLLEEILETATEGLSVRAKAARVTISRARPPADSPVGIPVWADIERVGQAIHHILTTSIASCGEGGKILTRIVHFKAGEAELQVRDHGAGFTTEEIDEALHAFGGEHRGLNRPFAGPGVGIAIAKTFIEMQAGRFVIQSRPGKGSLFTIALPHAAENSASQVSTAAEADARAHALAKSA